MCVSVLFWLCKDVGSSDVSQRVRNGLDPPSCFQHATVTTLCRELRFRLLDYMQSTS